MADLSQYWLADCEVSVRTRAGVVNCFGPRVTLADLDTKTDDELYRTPHLGRRAVKEIREVIANMKAWPDPPEAKPAKAIENLRTCQRQLDADGVEVGVSREALEKLLSWVARN